MLMEKYRARLTAQLGTAAYVRRFNKEKQDSLSLVSFETPMKVVQALRKKGIISPKERDELTLALVAKVQQGRWDGWSSILFLGYSKFLRGLKAKVRLTAEEASVETEDMVLLVFWDFVHQLDVATMRLDLLRKDEDDKQGFFFTNALKNLLRRNRRRSLAQKRQDRQSHNYWLSDHGAGEAEPIDPYLGGEEKLLWCTPDEVCEYLNAQPFLDVLVLEETYYQDCTMKAWLEEHIPSDLLERQQSIYRALLRRRDRLTENIKDRFDDELASKEIFLSGFSRWQREHRGQALNRAELLRAIA